VKTQASGFKNTQLFPQREKSCSVSGFALLSSGEKPCPLSLQTVFSSTGLRLIIKIRGAKEARFRTT